MDAPGRSAPTSCSSAIFLFAPMIVMAVLSFQGPDGQLHVPDAAAPASTGGGRCSTRTSAARTATAIKTAALTSLYLALVVGAVVAVLALTPVDGVPAAVPRRRRALLPDPARADDARASCSRSGRRCSGRSLGISPDICDPTGRVGTNVVWGLPVRLPDHGRRLEPLRPARSRRPRATSAPRARRTFREVTLPLIWTGLFGAFLFGFTLSWNEYDRTALLLGSGQLTLPIQIFALTTGSVIRPEPVRARNARPRSSPRRRGVLLVVAAIRFGGVKRRRAARGSRSPRSSARSRGSTTLVRPPSRAPPAPASRAR